jgi:AcrR family transcriptional regulator
VRTVGSNGPRTQEALRAKAVELICEHGFEAMTLRMLAEGVGIQPGSLYNHIKTKQDLLFDLVTNHLRQIILHLDEVLSRSIPEPQERLKTFVAFHVEQHIIRRQEVFVGNSELRSLDPDNLRVVKGLRREYERRLIEILREGRLENVFRLSDEKVTAYAILAMLTGVCTWFKPGGAIGTAELIGMHTTLVTRMVL